jgi:hypothetical protein
MLFTAEAGELSPTFKPGIPQGTIHIAELTEASGLVASRNNPGVLWTHNDSGNPAMLFAIDTQGRKLGAYAVAGTSNRDWEDIAIGPGATTNVQCLYVGDIGDNKLKRKDIKVCQILEPAVPLSQYTNPVAANLEGSRAITLTYPDGAHNAESMFVDPWSGDLFIVTKESATCRVYTAKMTALASSTVTLSHVRSIAYSNPSAADISPAGTEIIIRRVNSARLWTRRPDQTVGDALAGSYVSVPVIGPPTEPQGEAIAFAQDGGDYYTVSEGASPVLYFFECTN